nr:hypothetical protein [uncultured Novosphingobium sp.]
MDRLGLKAWLCMVGLLPAPAYATPEKVIRTVDLAAPFEARSPWQLIVRQGGEEEDPSGEMAPGPITACISRDRERSCHPATSAALRLPAGDDAFSVPHYLQRADVVRPGSEHPLLLVQFASFHAGNNDQRIGMQLYAYDRVKDDFALVFARRTGRNNNQELRYVEAGPLQGAVIAAEPTGDAPYGYWITVDRLSPQGPYRQVLRFRSATTYGDGNPLAVIDAEMPNIHNRLGLRRAGQPLPLPASGCPQPRLVKMALWCR